MRCRTTGPAGATRPWQWWGRGRDIIKNNNLPQQLLAWQIPKPSKTLDKQRFWAKCGAHTGFCVRAGDSSAGIWLHLPASVSFSARITAWLWHTVSVHVICGCSGLIITILLHLPRFSALEAICASGALSSKTFRAPLWLKDKVQASWSGPSTLTLHLYCSILFKINLLLDASTKQVHLTAWHTFCCFPVFGI